MAARTKYSTEVAAYLDRQIATAKAQAKQAAHVDQSRTHVSEQVGASVVQTLVQVLRVRVRRGLVSVVVPLLPLAAVGLGALLRALGQRGVASAPAIAALLVLALFLPWRTWQVIRRARGRPPAPFPLSGLIRRRSARRRSVYVYVDDLPTLSSLAAPLLGGLITVPALLVLTLTPVAPGLLIGSLVALPIVVTALWVALDTTISGLRAVGAVNTPSIVAVPAQASSLGHLDERLTRLTQMRDWLRDDSLRAMVDEAIGQQVRASERRQVAYSAVVGIVSLVAGWMLSAVSPISVATLFHR
jgi:hypothetical protein